MKRVISLLCLCMLLFISGCAQGEAKSGGQANYEEIKKMVVDILKTDEGKAAMKEVMGDEEMKKAFVMENSMVKDTIKQELTSEDAKKFWNKQFEDPKFAENFAKSIQKEHEELIKNLMKDPDYQKALMEILKDPEMEKEMLDLLKSQTYREQVKTIMLETIESPLFKAKMEEILIKGAEELQQTKSEEGGGESQKKDQGGQESGGGSAKES